MATANEGVAVEIVYIGPEWHGHSCSQRHREQGACVTRVAGGVVGAFYIVLVPVCILLACARRHEFKTRRLLRRVRALRVSAPQHASS